MQLYSSLAANGYRRVEITDTVNPPTQILFFTWGMFNRGYNEESGMRGNIRSRAKLIGGQRFADEFDQVLRDDRAWGGGGPNGRGPMRDFAERDELTETLVYAVYNECYYLLVTALEVEALRQSQRKILWTTKISTIAQGVNFKATLPIMINNASYYFGRETNGPEILRKRAYKRTNVEIGEATVVEFMPGVTGTTSRPARPATSGTAGGAR
jgi:predicted secreted protein